MDERSANLEQTPPPHVIVELTRRSAISDMAVTERMRWPPAVQAMPFASPAASCAFPAFSGNSNRPRLPNAVAFIRGPGFPAKQSRIPAGLATCRRTPSMAPVIDSVSVPVRRRTTGSAIFRSVAGSGARECQSLIALKRTSAEVSGRTALQLGSTKDNSIGLHRLGMARHKIVSLT